MRWQTKAQSWIDAIYSAFSVVEFPKSRELCDVTFLVRGLPKTVSESMAVSSSATLSNFGAAFFITTATRCKQ